MSSGYDYLFYISERNIYATKTVASVFPLVTQYPATVLVTVISTVTWQYETAYVVRFDNGYTETHFSTGTFTDTPNSAVLYRDL